MVPKPERDELREIRNKSTARFDGMMMRWLFTSANNMEVFSDEVNYVINACNAVPKLLDALDAAEAEIERLKRQLSNNEKFYNGGF